MKTVLPILSASPLKPALVCLVLLSFVVGCASQARRSEHDDRIRGEADARVYVEPAPLTFGMGTVDAGIFPFGIGGTLF